LLSGNIFKMSNYKEVLRVHGLNDDDAQKMISDVVFFFLVADQKKTVIKRADLVKNCDLGKKPKNLQDWIIGQASKNLADTFGIEVSEMSKGGQFVLINKLDEVKGHEFLHWSEKETAQQGVLFTILGLILMSNDKVTDEVLFKFLRQMGIYEDEKSNRPSKIVVDPEVSELFDGDVKKFVNDILVTKQHYLKREKVQGPDPETEVFEYSWGERAKKEVRESSVFKMVCTVYDCDGRMFKEQMDRIKEREPDLDEDFFSNANPA